jgi:hypothetical protein
MQNWSFICIRVRIDTKPALIYQRYYNRLIGILIGVFQGQLEDCDFVVFYSRNLLYRSTFESTMLLTWILLRTTSCKLG